MCVFACNCASHNFSEIQLTISYFVTFTHDSMLTALISGSKKEEACEKGTSPSSLEHLPKAARWPSSR